MKQILGFCAAIIGGILLPGGILAMIFLVPAALTPDGQYYDIPLEIGFLAAFLGFLLCYLAWALLPLGVKTETHLNSEEETTRRETLPELRLYRVGQFQDLRKLRDRC